MSDVCDTDDIDDIFHVRQLLIHDDTDDTDDTVSDVTLTNRKHSTPNADWLTRTLPLMTKVRLTSLR